MTATEQAPRPAGTAPAPTATSPRRLEVLCCVANLGSTRLAARRLHLTREGVKSDLRYAYKDLGQATLTRAVLTALAAGQVRLFRDGTIAPAAEKGRA